MAIDKVIDKIDYLTNKIEKKRELYLKNKQKFTNKIFKLENEVRNLNKDLSKYNAKKTLTLAPSIFLAFSGISTLLCLLIFNMYNLLGIIIGSCLTVASIGLAIPGIKYLLKENHIKKEIEKLENSKKEQIKNIVLETERIQRLDERREKLFNRIERELKRTVKRVEKNAPVRNKNLKKRRKRKIKKIEENIK